MPPTTWYPLLGSIFSELLTPLGGVHVDDRCPLTALTRPHLHDFLLLRRDLPNWSREQYRRLPDGISDSTKNHLLITFYSQASGNSFGWRMQELLGIGHFYHQSYNLAQDAIDSFLLCAERPSPSSWGNAPYPPTAISGVYKHHLPILNRITVICLSELEATPQNAFLKTFASSQAVKKGAFAAVRPLQPLHPQALLAHGGAVGALARGRTGHEYAAPPPRHPTKGQDVAR
jgi:hypothetical protein